MSTSPAISTKSPQQCSASELSDFTTLVLAGGEVIEKNLRSRVLEALALCFLRENSCLIGIAALKNPSTEYRTSVFKKARATASASEYPYELGWLFVVPSARGRKLSHSLVQAAVNHAAQAQVFATSRTANPAIHAPLMAASFAKHGNEYASNRGPHRLALFLRNVPAQ
jgi:predicted GNAT family N-acyltransferase